VFATLSLVIAPWLDIVIAGAMTQPIAGARVRS